MIAIGKAKSFTSCKMSTNVLLFEHMHSKVAKSANMTKIGVWVRGTYQKTQNLLMISNSLKWAQKNNTDFAFQILHFFAMFFPITFFGTYF
jgi:hypothetical protein